mgnify:CR=1 FL=1
MKGFDFSKFMLGVGYMYEQIPQELKALPNWICWDAVPDEKRGKIKKVPINALTGGGAI